MARLATASQKETSTGPDFLFVRDGADGGGKYEIVEVKADSQVDEKVVQAKKDVANQMAVASSMEDRLIKVTDADARNCRMLL